MSSLEGQTNIKEDTDSAFEPFSIRGGVRVWPKETGLGKRCPEKNNQFGWNRHRFKKPVAVGLHGFKPHPPHLN